MEQFVHREVGNTEILLCVLCVVSSKVLVGNNTSNEGAFPRHLS